MEIAKDDKGKAKLSLVPVQIIRDIAVVREFVGLSFEKAAARRSALACARTFASREVFLPMHMSSAKMF